MDLKTLLPVAIQASLFLVVFAVGLRAAPFDALYLLRRPGLLARSLLAIDVVVPLFAALVVSVLPLTPVVRLGIVLMALSPLPPFVPGKQLKVGGEVSYVCGLLVAVSLLSVVTVPATLALFLGLFPTDSFVQPRALARFVALSVMLPMGVGMAIHGLSPKVAMRAAPVASHVANIVLVVIVVPIIITVWPAMMALIGNGSVFAIAAVVLVALAAGHLLGGPDEDDRTALAIASATRHPGIALLVGRASFADTQIAPSIMLFIIVGTLVAAPYQVWRRRRLKIAAEMIVKTAAASHPASPA